MTNDNDEINPTNGTFFGIPDDDNLDYDETETDSDEETLEDDELDDDSDDWEDEELEGDMDENGNPIPDPDDEKNYSEEDEELGVWRGEMIFTGDDSDRDDMEHSYYSSQDFSEYNGEDSY